MAQTFKQLGRARTKSLSGAKLHDAKDGWTAAPYALRLRSGRAHVAVKLCGCEGVFRARGLQRTTHTRQPTRVQTTVSRHAKRTGRAPGRLRAPGVHRVACGDLLANAVEDFPAAAARCELID